METHVCVSDTCVSNHHKGTQSIDAIEHTFGTLILNTLAGAVNDGDKIQMLRPTLDTIISNGNDKDGFLLEFIFFVSIECTEPDVDDRKIFKKNSSNRSQQDGNLYKNSGLDIIWMLLMVVHHLYSL